MRIKRLTTWLVLGIAVLLVYSGRRRRGAPQRRVVPADVRGTPAEIDDSVLGRDGEAADLFVEAIAGWDVEPDDELQVSVSEPTDYEPRARTAEEEEALGQSARVDVYGDRRAPLGAGELYGAHTPPAVERQLPDDDRAQDQGESWLEHLNASSAETGPEPERILDVTDDTDPHAGHHKTLTTDTPVADHGSGGPRGL